MRNLAQTSAVLAALLGASGALAIAAVGCGGDDTAVNTGDGGQTDGSGGQTDGTMADQKAGHADAKPDDAKTDHKKGDGSSGDDGPATGDDGPATGDDGPATGDDGGSTDGNPGDASHADADAGPVDAAALYAFPNAVNTAYCQRLASCCGDGDGGTDAGAKFIDTCVTLFSGGGGIADVNLANVHGGHMKYNAASAKACLDDINGLPCGSYTDTEWLTLLSDCSAAMSGTIPLNSTGCSSPWECEAPGYCQGTSGAIDSLYADDGGFLGVYQNSGGLSDAGTTGTCTELRTAGSSCTDLSFYADCNLYGNGSPANFCNPNDAGTAGTCVADYAPGASSSACLYNQQCTTQVCIPGIGCETTGVFSDLGTPNGICASY